MKVLITGGSGLIGGKVTELLLAKNIEVVHLTRALNSKFGIKTYKWDWQKKEIDERCFEGITDIIHLAGAGIADRPWTMARKHEIIQSRVYSANLLFEKVQELNLQLNSYISASGIGYYGALNSDNIFTEEDFPYNDFIAKSCIYWEKSADQFKDRTRVVKLRTGIVLAKEKGALPKISKTIGLNLGSPIGTGNQAFPWVHIDDIASLYFEVLFNDKYKGVFNAVAPSKINNKDLTQSIAKVLNKKLFLPKVPAFVLKFIYGELSDVILKGSLVSSDKLSSKGFEFEFSEIEEALNDIYKKRK